VKRREWEKLAEGRLSGVVLQGKKVEKRGKTRSKERKKKETRFKRKETRGKKTFLPKGPSG